MFENTAQDNIGFGGHAASTRAATQGVAGRTFALAMRADNADMISGLALIVAAPLAEIPGSLRPVLIADIRKRHTTMPAGREISHRMQRYMERALMQARLHLMGDPGARGEFELAAAQYAERLQIRRGLAASHLAQLGADVPTLANTLEWCDRLVTKHTPQELKGLRLGEAAMRLDRIAQELGMQGNAVLVATVAFLSNDTGPTLVAAERIRGALAEGAGTAGDSIPGEFWFRSRRLA